ncbi:MAG: hypothetical protein E6G57_10780 [Actinobacteria bacterium]|nr:MAG: hypothetical protein E6G57_10780 [Actinomycetota bacterium]
MSAPTVQFPPPPSGAQDASGGWIGPSGRVELGASALGGWAALETGDDDVAGRAAALCRRFAWEQPDDAPGVLLGWEDDRPAEPLARANASGQPYGDLGAAAAFLARSFEEAGDVDDLDAAVELHDLVVAMGEGVWEPANALVGWGGALLYEITGEDAFLATAERMADVLAETQAPSGTWHDGDEVLTQLCAAALVAMADAVEARVEVEQMLADDE